MVRLPAASMITQRRDGTEANPPRFETASLIIGRMNRPPGALRVGRSWLVVFRGLAGISRAGLIDRGILIRLCGNPVREGNRRLPARPSAGLRRPLSFLSRQFFPGVQETSLIVGKNFLTSVLRRSISAPNALGKTFTGGFKLFGVNLNPACRRSKWSWNRANGAF